MQVTGLRVSRRTRLRQKAGQRTGRHSAAQFFGQSDLARFASRFDGFQDAFAMRTGSEAIAVAVFT